MDFLNLNPQICVVTHITCIYALFLGGDVMESNIKVLFGKCIDESCLGDTRERG